MADKYVLLVTKAKINRIEKSLNGLLGRWFAVDSETLDQNGNIQTVVVNWRMIYKEVGGKGVINSQKLFGRFEGLPPGRRDEISIRYGSDIRSMYLNDRVLLSTVKFPEVL